MKEYFNFNFTLENNMPSTKISLKDEFKKKGKPLRKNGMPLNGLEYDFYHYHIQDSELAISLCDFRKKFANQKTLYDFLYHENMITKIEYDCVNNWLANVAMKQKENHKNKMCQEETRQKISKGSNRKLLSENSKKMWEDKREMLLEAQHNPITKEKRISSFKEYCKNNHETYLEKMRKPERLKKISDASKNMWKNFTKEQYDLYRPRFEKNQEYKGIKMNAFEKRIAIILDELNLVWEYEKPIKYETSYIVPDFIVNNNIVVECFGDYWHANPTKYADDYVLYGKKTARMQREQDKKRLELLEKEFSKVIIIWEFDLNVKEKLGDLCISQKN